MLEILNRIANNKNITNDDLNKFIVEYCELALKKTITKQDLEDILNMIRNGLFHIRYAIKNYCLLKKYNFVELIDLNKSLIIKTEIYE